jgi:GxxExxY protein
MNDEALTGRVIGCFLAAYNEIGFGLPESVYSAALEILFRDARIRARREHKVDVLFRGTRVGRYRVDYLVEEQLILELKSGHHLPPGSRAQLLTYLRIMRKQLGLLLFFGLTPQVERVSL